MVSLGHRPDERPVNAGKRRGTKSRRQCSTFIPTKNIQFYVVIFFARSVNEVICHGIPDQRELQEGDIVNRESFLFFLVLTFDCTEPLFQLIITHSFSLDDKQ